MKRIMINKLLTIAVVVITFSACKNVENKENKNEKVITERIQYDVLIKTPDPELEWYNQNIEGIKREDLIKTIINAAIDGKVKAYDYFYSVIPQDELSKLFTTTDTVTVLKNTESNETRDTIIYNSFNIQEITKIRFLEEWKINSSNFQIKKNVIGLMLMKENYGDSLELRGYSPLFWIYFDSKYPESLKLR